MWEAEDIPDEDLLYLRVHFSSLDEGLLAPRVFVGHGGGMSTYWNKYISAEGAWQDVERFGKKRENYGVLRLVVGEVRKIERAKVEHTPDFPHNRAHTDVLGTGPSKNPTEDEVEVRVNLMDKVDAWEIRHPSLRE